MIVCSKDSPATWLNIDLVCDTLPRCVKRCAIEVGVTAFTGLYNCRCGTLNTIAPECIVQEGVAPAQDPAAVDVWGLGVTLYITLVGKFPFQVLLSLHRLYSS